jgi:peptide-methionine (R)-S-oxide reductase
MSPDTDYKSLPEAYWRSKLSPEQFHILRQKGTEYAFSGDLYFNDEVGTYTCGACGLELFNSESKYPSGTGWPSFWNAISADRIELHDDFSHGMHRIEVRCARCGSHLGHVFTDSNTPSGDSFCINSASLKFKPADQETSS